MINIGTAKSSVARGIRAEIIRQYPKIEEFIEEILPKKQSIEIGKWYQIFRFFLCANFCNFFPVQTTCLLLL